jgi:two-component system LytT family response regulator
MIVDDERIARQGIRLWLDVNPAIDVVAECGDGLSAVTAIRELAPELVFLDVQMPGLDGFGVIEAVGPEVMPTTVFVTAYDQHAIRAFEAHAIDYLLKPFDDARFAQALKHARRQIDLMRRGEMGEQLRSLIREVSDKFLKRLVIKAPGRVYFVSVTDVDWIEAADNYVQVHTGRDVHLLRETVNALETRLDPDQFVRIRRSTIVNVARIKELRPQLSGEYTVVLVGGTSLTSSRRFRGKLSRLLGE